MPDIYDHKLSPRMRAARRRPGETVDRWDTRIGETWWVDEIPVEADYREAWAEALERAAG